MGISRFSESISEQGRVNLAIYHASDVAHLDPVAHTEDDLRGVTPIDVIRSHNLLVDSGKRFLGNMIKGGFGVPVDVGVGTNNLAAAAGDTTLVTEVFRDAITQRIDIVDGVRIRFFLTANSANGNTLREAGIFGPSPDFAMLARVTFADVIKTTSIALNLSWDITFSQP